MIKAVVNNEKTYQVSNWDARAFQGNLQITLKSTNLNKIKTDFKEVQMLEIYENDNLLAVYTSLDTFSEITYVGTVYDRITETFSECVRVTLTKANIAEQIQRLDEQINPVINPDSMDLTEYKNYKIGILKEQTSASIYSGSPVTLLDGSVEEFSFDHNDQIDLIALSNLAMLNPSLELPWHSNGNVCRTYSGYDIILIYQTLYMKLMREVTVYNAIHQLILGAQTKAEIDNYYYGCSLPQDVQDRVDLIISRMISTAAEILERFKPPVEEETVEPEPEEPTENSEVTEPENTEPENNEPEILEPTVTEPEESENTEIPQEPIDETSTDGDNQENEIIDNQDESEETPAEEPEENTEGESSDSAIE